MHSTHYCLDSIYIDRSTTAEVDALQDIEISTRRVHASRQEFFTLSRFLRCLIFHVHQRKN